MKEERYRADGSGDPCSSGRRTLRRLGRWSVWSRFFVGGEILAGETALELVGSLLLPGEFFLALLESVVGLRHLAPFKRDVLQGNLTR